MTSALLWRLAAMGLCACDAQVDGSYPGEALARLHGTAVGFRPDDLADGAAVRWNAQTGVDRTAGPLTALPLETSPPSGVWVIVLAAPPDPAYFEFPGEPARLAEGTLFLTRSGELVGEAIDFALVHVEGSVAPGSLAAVYLDGAPAAGFHLYTVRPTAGLSAAQAYLAARCGDSAECRAPRRYQLVAHPSDLGAELQFFRGAP